MTIAKEFAAKLAVAFVAAAMIVSAFAPAAQAQTTEDLQQMINDLLAQVAALQAQTGQGATEVASGVCPYTWTRDLSMGSEGDDVMKLQQFLNADPDTRVAATGAGSVGMETMYYGPATAAAVSKMQVKYRDQVLAPANLVNPTGYFGPSSRNAANGLCVTAPTTGGGDMDGGDDEGDDSTEEEDDNGSMTLSGEGTLATFEVDDDEDEVMEGAEDVVVAVITAEAEDGDIEMARMSFTLVDAGTVNDEIDPWDVFTEVSLWVDGDKIASFEADDEDEYLDEDAGEFRFSNLDLFMEEDDEIEILVAVSVMNSVDGADDNTAATSDWDITPTEVRYFDADGVATTEDNFDEMGDSEYFEIVAEGQDDEADVASNSSNPEEGYILVEEDNNESDEVLVHVFDVEIGRDSSDLSLEDAYVWVTIGNPVGAAGAILASDVIDTVTLTIDGESVEGDELYLGGDANNDDEDTEFDHSIAAGETNRIPFLFEFDGLMLDGDTDYEVEVEMTFQGQDDGNNYGNGVTVMTDVVSELTGLAGSWRLEGEADDFLLDGDDSSDVHDLLSSGIDVEVVSAETDVTAEDGDAVAGPDTVEFKWVLDITAVGEDDVYINSTLANIVDTITADTDLEVGYEIERSTGAALASVSGTISSPADDITGDAGAYGGAYNGEEFFLITSGETERVTINVSGTNQTDAKQVQAFLEGIEWTLDEVDATTKDGLTAAVSTFVSQLPEESETGFAQVN